MTFLAPAGAAFLAALPIIVAFHFLRIRRQEVTIATNFLWERALREQQVRRPWRRFRVSLLLALQVLAAILAALALMRPATATAKTLGPDTAIVLEASASMSDTDVAPSRFEAAKAKARSMIEQMGDADRITLIAMGAHPAVLAQSTGDPAPLVDALDAARTDNGAPDLDAALAIVGAVNTGSSGVNVVVIGDGLVPSPRNGQPQPFPVSFVKVGKSGSDLGIPLLTADDAGDVTATVTNWGGQQQTTEVKLQADGTIVDVRSVTVPSNASRDVTFTLSGPASKLEASLSGSDSFALDDDAYALAAPAQKRVIQLVTKENVFLQRALQLRDDVTLTTVSPAAYSASAPADLDVFDGWAPPSLPSTPALLVNPPAGVDGSGNAVTPHTLLPHTLDDPLLADVGLTDVHIATAHDLANVRGTPVIDSDTGPVLVTQDSPRRAVLGFDVHNSDLPIKPAFPLLIQHLSVYLLPPLVDRTLHHPDTPVTIPLENGVTSVSVTDPGGTTTSVAVAAGSAVDTATDRLGIYTVHQQGHASADGTFAVSGTALTSLTPRDPQPISSLQPPSVSESRWIDQWRWLIVVLLVALVAEWWVFHRG